MNSTKIELIEILDALSIEKFHDFEKICSDLCLEFHTSHTFDGTISDYEKKQLNNVFCDIGKNVTEKKVDKVTKMNDIIDQKLKTFSKLEQQSFNELFGSEKRDEILKNIEDNITEFSKIQEKLEVLKRSVDTNKLPKKLFFENEIKKNTVLKDKIRDLKTNPLNTMFEIADNTSLDIEIRKLKQAIDLISQQNLSLNET